MREGGAELADAAAIGLHNLRVQDDRRHGLMFRQGCLSRFQGILPILQRVLDLCHIRAGGNRIDQVADFVL
ncbi:hypothetical protein NUH86_01535 [Sphingobium sp. JS3065]|uniref:hypothetical protein n=1 Tax=Sphingobium sp. JS3065 TaxID=2970925 RepID=UPI002263B0A2|nr:hypothetical protein [Sphingobium sp. JS3065]UZW55512.1 hypothetical protein NUH86_01535 [Sphingobium sp. JS3065]